MVLSCYHNVLIMVVLILIVQRVGHLNQSPNLGETIPVPTWATADTFQG